MARNLFEPSKAGDDRTLGEKAIGLLAFQQLGGCCEVVSRAAGTDETWTLRLRRGDASAELLREKRRARATSGTTVFISELDIEASRVLTQRKVVEYMRRRRGAAIAAGAVVGRAGTTIIDDLTDLEEFDHEPWTSGHLSGRMSFEPLRQSAGRRAILRDDEIYPVFRDAVLSVEPVLTRAIERIRRDLDIATAERLGDALRQVFGRVLRELADLENPMRTLVGDEPDIDGEGIASVLAVGSRRRYWSAAVDRGPRSQRRVRLTTGADDPPWRWPRSTTAPTVDRA